MRHLLALRDLGREDILGLLDRAEKAADSRALDGRRVALWFHEPSTRTKVSFTLAARRLGAETLDISPAASSMAKGESIPDTVRTLEALGVSVIVSRHGAAGFAHLLARTARAAVVNAGDGMHEHPTQALVDLLVLRRQFGRTSGLHIVIVGDIRHSRVARSHLAAHAQLENDVTLVGPPTLVPRELAGPRVRIRHDLEAALAEADVVVALRIQRERMAGHFIPSLEEFRDLYGIDERRLARMRPTAILMHPGPMNTGVEITASAAAAPPSRILEQVEASVDVRMAVLQWVVC